MERNEYQLVSPSEVTHMVVVLDQEFAEQARSMCLTTGLKNRIMTHNRTCSSLIGGALLPDRNPEYPFMNDSWHQPSGHYHKVRGGEASIHHLV